jgi:hypothetical protein
MKKSEKRIDLYVDSEWSSNQEMLSFQVVYRDLQNIEKKVFILPEKVMNILYHKSIEIKRGKVTDLIIIKDDTPVFDTFIKLLDEQGLINPQSKDNIIQIHFYWSIVDLYYLFGEKFILECIDKDEIQKRSNLLTNKFATICKGPI